MTAGELKRLLQDVPDSMPVAVEYDAGCCREQEIGARVEDGLLILDADPDMRPVSR